MTLQTVTLSELQTTGANPRKFFDDTALNGLAASIRQDGLLQNLVIAPVKGKNGKYRIIAGERRFRALKLLAANGDIKDDFAVPVEIRSDLSSEDTLRVATVENVQRENLAPLEEAKAFAGLIRKGETLSDIAAQTGLTERLIKRRCALNSLCDEGQKALTAKEITLAQAEALCIGSAEDQNKILEKLGNGWDYDPDEIRDYFTHDLPSVSMAIFPLSEYKSGYIHDLFADGETTFFEDAAQFLELQRKAVNDLKDYFYRASPAKWVEITENHSLRQWLYEEADEGEPYGVLINIAPSGEIEYREYLIKPEIDEKTKEELSDAPKKQKASYTISMRRYIAWHKSMAAQAALLSNPRKVRELTVLNALRRFTPHSCLKQLSELSNPQSAYRIIEEHAKDIAALMGLKTDGKNPAWHVLSYGRPEEGKLYAKLKSLSEDELDQILAFTTILDFGQSYCDRLDTDKGSLFNMTAKDLSIDMRDSWTPCETFLAGRTKDQLATLSGKCGYNSPGFVASFKKGELVTALSRHYQSAKQSEKPNERQKKALKYLPGVMKFPAVNPDKKPGKETGK